jgi:large subunit ribosomal protein L10
MAITKQKKQAILTELTQRIEDASAVVITDPTGLKIGEITEIRRALQEKGVSYTVVKKTLLKLTESKLEMNFDDSAYSGSVGLAFSNKDEVEPAKLSHEIAKKYENFRLLGGIFQNKFINLDQVNSLALIPSREVLYAKVVGSMASPMSGMVNVLSGNIRNLVNVIRNYQEKIS